MRITEVSVRMVYEQSRLRAMASIVFDDAFAVHGIRIIEGSDGLFLAMPSRERKTGAYRDIAHPITAELRIEMETVILAIYNKMLSEGKKAVTDERIPNPEAGDERPQQLPGKQVD